MFNVCKYRHAQDREKGVLVQLLSNWMEFTSPSPKLMEKIFCQINLVPTHGCEELVASTEYVVFLLLNTAGPNDRPKRYINPENGYPRDVSTSTDKCPQFSAQRVPCTSGFFTTSGKNEFPCSRPELCRSAFNR